MIDRLQPLGIEAALAGIKARSQKRSEKRDQLDFALRQARFERLGARLNPDTGDPAQPACSRRVRETLERATCCSAKSETEINRLDDRIELLLTNVDRERLMAFGRNVAAAWNSPGATHEKRA